MPVFNMLSRIAAAQIINNTMLQDLDAPYSDHLCVAQGDVFDYPTAAPTALPTPLPTPPPTGQPTVLPTALPTPLPTLLPTALPTVLPTVLPTALPTSLPTALPTALPTTLPTSLPSSLPTASPTAPPTPSPTVLIELGAYATLGMGGVSCFDLGTAESAAIAAGLVSILTTSRRRLTWPGDVAPYDDDDSSAPEFRHLLRGRRVAGPTAFHARRSLFDVDDGSSDSDPTVEVGECADASRRLTPAEEKEGARLARSGDDRRLSAGVALGMTITSTAHTVESDNSGAYVSELSSALSTAVSSGALASSIASAAASAGLSSLASLSVTGVSVDTHIPSPAPTPLPTPPPTISSHPTPLPSSLPTSMPSSLPTASPTRVPIPAPTPSLTPAPTPWLPTPMPTDLSCTDDRQNGEESDIDCGGG